MRHTCVIGLSNTSWIIGSYFRATRHRFKTWMMLMLCVKQKQSQFWRIEHLCTNMFMCFTYRFWRRRWWWSADWCQTLCTSRMCCIYLWSLKISPNYRKHRDEQIEMWMKWWCALAYIGFSGQRWRFEFYRTKFTTFNNRCTLRLLGQWRFRLMWIRCMQFSRWSKFASSWLWCSTWWPNAYKHFCCFFFRIETNKSVFTNYYLYNWFEWLLMDADIEHATYIHIYVYEIRRNHMQKYLKAIHFFNENFKRAEIYKLIDWK